MSAIELIDELEAGELSVEFEGQEPWELLEWALERFSPRIGLSTAFQIDGVALLDMAYELDPSIQVFSVDTGRLPTETYELIERLITAWLAARRPDEDFRGFCDRMSDEELGILAGREPARGREEKEAA